MRLGDLEEIDNLGIEFPDTNVYVPIEKIWDLPEIDPETLPIVQKLRAKNFMLQTNIESLEKQITQITTERNAAIEQLHGECSACKHYSQYHAKGKCKNCKWDNASLSRPVERWDDCWEWVGLQKVRNNE